MAVTSFVYPSSAGTSDTGGGPAWTNYNNVKAADAQNAYVTPGSATTDKLWATNFGISLPSNAIVDGIEFVIYKSRSGGSGVYDGTVQVIISGSSTGSDLATYTDWDSVGAVTYGGPTTNWGSYDKDDVEASGFGIGLSCYSNDGGEVAMVEYIKLRVYYHILVYPTVTTQATDTTVPGGATLNGNITDDGGASITQHGFCWKAGSDPVNIAGADGSSTLGAGSEGAFNQAKTGLTENTTFYVRSYATNSKGTSYGAAVSFTTGETLTMGTALTAQGTLAIDGLTTTVFAAALTAAGVLSGIPIRVCSGIIALTAAGEMAATVRGVFVVFAPLTAQGEVAATSWGPGVKRAAAVLAATGVVAPDAVVFHIWQASLTQASVVAATCQAGDLKYIAATLDAAGTLTYAGLAFATKRLIYSGTLESGDVLVIDTDEMTVKLNGTNVTMYFTGDFFELFVGDNEIEYYDHEGSRTALVSIDHSDKWI